MGVIEGNKYNGKYRIFLNKKTKGYEDITVENIQDFMKEKEIKEIEKIKIETGDVSPKYLIELIDYTTKLEKNGKYYCLNSGKWTEFNWEYIEKVEREIKEEINKIIEFKSEYNFKNLEKLRRKYVLEITGQDKIEGKEKTLYKERVYNYQMRDKFGFTLMDRNCIDSLEVSDLYSNNDKSLIHVKLELQEHL